MEQIKTDVKELELYIHIPFCIKKCAYCDFLSAPADDSVRLSYVRRLAEEIKTYAPDFRDYQVSSIFFGGGTPSVLEGQHIAQLMDVIYRSFRVAGEAEISIECNPGTLTPEKAKTMVQSGLNRISFGLQSADDKELELLGRIHSFEVFLESFDEARKAGFCNINVDLMSALPGQTPKSWEQTLRQVTALRPEHISAYSLIIEEGTPFYERYHSDELLRQKGERPVLLPSEEEERQMYELTGSFLGKKGYQRYEISNYAKNGFECRHNIGYWTRKNYLGLGLGSSSLIGNIRFQNTAILKDYLEHPFRHLEVQELGKHARMEEFMFLGLRLTEGISRIRFEELFGVSIDGIYGDVLRRLKAQKLVKENGGRIWLTPKGVDVSNMVLAEFLL